MDGLFDIDEETGEVISDDVWDVTRVTAHIKRLLSSDKTLSLITVKGEITNLSRSSAGHIYFGLKDEKAYLKCVSFRSSAQRLTDQPVDGEVALATGRIGLYEAGGSYQLYVDDLRLAGKGDMYLEFERLKKKLGEEGLFDEERKLKMPVFPRMVGVVTSPNGAAVRDILRVTADLSPHITIVISPALVQGATAPKSIIKAIDRLEKLDGMDMIIVGRGGGSFEDLNCFNDEALARRIAACKLPIVSAVGHETDFTISDFVADLRAPTPTAAAQMALPEREAFLEQTTGLVGEAADHIRQQIETGKQELDTLRARVALFRPADRIADARQSVDEVLARIGREIVTTIRQLRTEVKGTLSQLSALDPRSVLERGYSIAYAPDGSVLTDMKKVKKDDEVSIKLKIGGIRTRVTGKGKV